MIPINNNNDEPKELLILGIELGNQNKKYLKIYPDTEPDKLSYDFCLKNNLDYDSMQNLSIRIKNALNDAKKKLKESSKNINQNPLMIKEINKNDFCDKDKNIQTPKYNFIDLSGTINDVKKENIDFKITNLYNKTCQNFCRNRFNIKNNENKKDNIDIFCNDKSNENIKRVKNNYLSQTISSQSKALKKQKNNDRMYISKTISLKNGYIGLRDKIYTTNSYKPNFNDKNKKNKKNIKEKKNENMENSESDENINDSKDDILKTDDNNDDIIEEKNNSSIKEIEEINIYDNNTKKEIKPSQKLNFYKRLYQNGLKTKENTCERVKDEIVKALIKEEKECTFKPKINHIIFNNIDKSKKINYYSKNKKANQSDENRKNREIGKSKRKN